MAVFFIAFLISSIFCLIFNYFGKMSASIKPNLRDRVTGISKAGGIAIVASFFFTFFLFKQEMMMPFLLLGLFFVFILGVMDDVFNLSVLSKFLMQLLIAIYFVSIGIKLQVIYFSDFFNFVFSLLWIIGLMNAFNFFDILDGLAVGISVTTAISFAIMGSLTHNKQIAMMALCIAASNIPFMFFNFPKARLYMGDTGSMFNGALFACMAILLTYASPGKEIAVWTPLLILALPLYDLFFVVVMRLCTGRHIVRKSQDHFVLRLVRGGLTQTRSVILMFLFNSLFCLGAILFYVSSNSFILAVSLLIFTVGSWFILAFKLSKVRVI